VQIIQDAAFNRIFGFYLKLLWSNPEQERSRVETYVLWALVLLIIENSNSTFYQVHLAEMNGVILVSYYTV